MKIIAGLGNPGEKYRNTRHNIGFIFVDLLSRTYDIPFERKNLKALWGRGKILCEDVILVKPQTFMNLSGRSLQRFKDFYDIPLKDIFVIYDDVDLPFERLRIKRRGGAGGHKGVQSIIDSLGNNGFARLRLGIGRPERSDVTDYVLSPFTLDEDVALGPYLEKAKEALESAIDEGISVAMNRFNK